MHPQSDLTIFHQNIRGLYNKVDELINSWTTESHIGTLSYGTLLMQS
jgi:hypothetical protein